MLKNNRLKKENIQDILPLTPTQEGMLFHYLHNPESRQYYEQLELGITGRIEEVTFLEAWRHVINQNETLRTVFRWDKLEKPVQLIFKEFPVPVDIYDFYEEPEEKKYRLYENMKNNLLQQELDLTSEPFKIILCRLSKDNCGLIVKNHHILYDGWSTGIILREFFEAYNSINKNIKPPLKEKTQFKEYLKWYAAQDRNSQKEFWSRYLSGIDVVTPLPYDWKKR